MEYVDIKCKICQIQILYLNRHTYRKNRHTETMKTLNVTLPPYAGGNKITNLTFNVSDAG